MVALPLMLSLLAVIPADFAQGIELYPKDADSSGSVHLRGEGGQSCRLGNREQPCAFSVSPGPATLVINGRDYRIDVQPGLNTFTFAHRPNWLFPGGALSCLFGAPVLTLGLMGAMVLPPALVLGALAVAAVGLVATVISLPVMVIGLVVPPGEVQRVDGPQRFIAAARKAQPGLRVTVASLSGRKA